MRKHIISAVIGGLMGPIAGFCTAMDIATIRNLGRPAAPVQSVTDRRLGETSEIRRKG